MYRYQKINVHFECDSIVIVLWGNKRNKCFILLIPRERKKKRIQFIDIGAHNEHQCMHIFKLKDIKTKMKTMQITFYACERQHFFSISLSIWTECNVLVTESIFISNPTAIAHNFFFHRLTIKGSLWNFFFFKEKTKKSTTAANEINLKSMYICMLSNVSSAEAETRGCINFRLKLIYNQI